jgi:hypothetical protein
MTKPKPLIFIGSSREGLDIAYAVQTILQDDAEVTVWDQNFFQLTYGSLESLEKSIDRYDFAVLILTPDDLVVSRNVTYPAARDNVFIEFGLFMGRLGRDRTFIVYDKNSQPKIPSDLSGITFALYQGDRSDKNWVAALRPACQQIRQCLNSKEVRKHLPKLNQVPESLSFTQMIKEYYEMLGRLELPNSRILREIKNRGDFKRLIDGLFNGLLYVSRALVTGYVDPTFYGNMMEYDQKTETLRVKYFAGPYNEEIICRIFPIEGLLTGVASRAFRENKIAIENSGENLLRLKGEGRLKSMMSIPVESKETCLEKTVVTLNIDSAIENAFPNESSADFQMINERIREIALLIQRVNNLACLLKNNGNIL